MGLKVGHLSMFLCTLQRPYKIPDLVEPTASIFFCCSTLKAPDDFRDFKYSLIRFSWFIVKLSEPILFLFLPRIRFPRTKSVPAIIRSKYGDKIFKMMRKLEKLDFKLRQAEHVIKFL